MSKTDTKAAKQLKKSKPATRAAEPMVETTFQLEADSGSEVYVAGTFNDWDPREDELASDGNGTFGATLRIPKGAHEYKFIINGVWCVDPECENLILNTLGSMNCVMHVM